MSIMNNELSESIVQVLENHKKLFNYKNILLFPRIENSKIKPSFTFEPELNSEIYSSNELDWLNFYTEVLLLNELKNDSIIKDFFNKYNIDVLFPIREEKDCFGFLGISAHGKPPNNLELNINQIIVHFLANYWNNQLLLREAQVSSQNLQSLVDEISTLHEISRIIESNENLLNILEFILEKCMDVMKVKAGSILLMNDDKNGLEFRVALGPKANEIKPFTVPLGKGIAGWVAKHDEPLIIPDAYNDDRFNPDFDKKSGFKTQGILCVPLKFKNNVIGVVQVLNRIDNVPFQNNDLRILSIFASQAAIVIENSRLLYAELENEKIENDLALASEIQRLIIPDKLPAVPELKIYGTYLPSREIGGDFYNVFPVNKYETIFCIADVSGKGISGALLVSTLHATLRAYLEYTADMENIVSKLNDLIIELSTANKYITFFIAHLDHISSELTYINAGHNRPYWLQRNKPSQKLGSSGPAIGIMDFKYQIHRIQLNKDDLIVMYTDGLIDAWNKEKKPFGESKLKTIVDLHNEFDCKLLHDIIVQSMDLHTENVEHNDDFALLVFQIK